MDVRPGYKRTDLGVIPVDWDETKYTCIGDIIDGDRGVNYPSAEDFQDSGHCLFLNAGNVTKTGFQFEDRQFISADRDGKLNKGKLSRQDVVLTTRGTLGNFAYFSEKIPYDHIRINSGMVILRSTSSTVDQAYHYFVLRSRIVGFQIERLSFGSAQPQLTVKGIGTLKIPLPRTKAEQEAIAEVLSDADALIESLEQLLTKKRQIKKGAMQELLTGKKRLPGFSRDWEVKRLEEIAEIVMGQSPRSSNYSNIRSGLPLIQGNADISGRRAMRRVYTTEVTKRGYPRDILMSVRAPVGEISRTGFNVCLGRGVCAIRSSNNDFLYFVLVAKETTWAKLSKGSTFDSINSTDVRNIEIVQPFESAEQTAIATVLSDMDAEIAALEVKLVKARQLKQGMMQELLTGRIRLI